MVCEKLDYKTLHAYVTNIFKEEKELFLKLISVKGIGPKSAIAMLSKADYSNIIEAIEVGNLNYLKKLPKVNEIIKGDIFDNSSIEEKMDNIDKKVEETIIKPETNNSILPTPQPIVEKPVSNKPTISKGFTKNGYL